MESMADLYELHARRYPDREIYVFDDVRRTYGEFLVRIRQLATALERAGLQRQDRAAIIAANSIEYFEVYGACEIGSFIAAAFNVRSAPPELEYNISHCAPKLLFFDAMSLATVEAVRSSALGVSRFVYIGPDCPDWATPFETFLGEGDVAGPRTRPQRNDYCNLFYTSGTTGRPKGVPYTHHALLVTSERTALEEDMSLLQVTPAFHVGGRCPSLGAIWNAGKTVLRSNFDSDDWLRIVERERINTTFMVPMMMQAVLDNPSFGKYDISSLKWVMAASTAIPPPLLIRAVESIGPVFYVAYGSTECGGVTRLRRSETRADGPPEMTARLASVGHTETPVEIALLDEAGNSVPHGEVGEICVKSYCFSGYWNDEKATAEAMHGDYVRSGDMGRFDDRDYLYLVDRRKDMIISGGENIYSREVEDALHRHAAVQSASVIGVSDERWGERVLAVVVVRPGMTLDEAELIEFSKTQIAKFKCPKEVRFVAELPLSGTGKIDKLALRALYARVENRAS